MAVNPNDEEAIKRVINYPKRGIGATTVGKLQEAAASTGQSIWNIICGLNDRPYGLNGGTISKLMKFANLVNGFAMKIEHETAFELASRVSSETGIIKELYNDRSPEGVSRHENIQELLNAIQDFTQIALEEGKENKLANYLEDVALLTDHDNEKDEDRNKISMMTIHSSKGLEFPYLYVVGMEEELFPSKLSTASPQELEEERRLFYVALTRAQEKVSLSFAKTRYKWGDMSYPRPSRFLKEIDPNFVDFSYEQEPEFSSFGSRISESDNSHERMATETRFQAKRKPGSRPTLSKTAPRIRPTGNSETNSNFEASDASKIQAGMHIEHQRFGKGKVLHLEGETPNIKATVFFQNVGQKQLLLKFAKLKIV